MNITAKTHKEEECDIGKFTGVSEEDAMQLAKTAIGKKHHTLLSSVIIDHGDGLVTVVVTSRSVWVGCH